MAKVSQTTVETKKFKLNETTIKINGRSVYQIEALKTFTVPAPIFEEQALNEVKVNVGELGGYVEFENNLDQIDNSWIVLNAVIMGKNTTITNNQYQRTDIFSF